MITISQIRAARALLGWGQKELGFQAGLSQTAITHIEVGRYRASDESLQAIRKALEQGGVEFIEGGVRRRSQAIEYVSGPDFTGQMIDYIYNTLRQEGGKEYLLYGYEPKKLNPEQVEEVHVHVARLQQAGLSERVLVRQGVDPDLLIGPRSWYRGVSDDIFYAASPSFIFCDRFAMMLFAQQQVIIIRNTDLAEAQRRKFNFLWDSAQPFG